MKPTTVEPRSPRACAATLAYYRRHRAAHPLPAGWSEDVTGLEEAAEDLDQELEPIPSLAFDKPGRKGELSVTVDLHNPVTATVGVTDIGRRVLNPEELTDLLYVLLGIELDPVEIEDPSPIREVEYSHGEVTATSADAEPELPHPPVVGRYWALCLPFPYQPNDQLHLEGGLHR